MAANGYIVVAPNRRGLPGFGRAWNDAISGDWGGQPIPTTCRRLTKFGRTLRGQSPARLRGGQLRRLFGLFSGGHQGRFKTFIAHCGLYNLTSWYPTTEEMFFAKHDIGGTLGAVLHKSYTQPELPKTGTRPSSSSTAARISGCPKTRAWKPSAPRSCRAFRAGFCTFPTRATGFRNLKMPCCGNACFSTGWGGPETGKMTLS